MVYKKESVIKRGEEAIIRTRKLWLIAGIISLSLGAIMALEPLVFLIKDNDQSILKILPTLYGLFGFGIFALIYRKVYKYIPLLEGCKDIERSIRKAVNKYNRINARAAKSAAKATSREVSYSVCSTEFRYKELYDLFQQNDVVTYIGYPSVVVSSLQVSKRSTNSNDSNHTFDPFFTDEEFEDLMEK